MAAENAQILLQKSKKSTAAYVHGVCSSKSNPDVTYEIFDSILNPSISINEWDGIEWCKHLLAGGVTPEDYTQIVRRYDNATTCGLVWTANFVAYRCRTCGISPCMSLCSECFQKGDHKGHDFNMFRSQAGGACDCGDKSVMKETGFCQRHGLQNQRNKPEAPPDLFCVAEVFMPRLFLRLVQHLRENSDICWLSSVELQTTAIQNAEAFLALLQTHSEMGAAMRDVMTRALTNPQIYYNLAVDCESGNHLQYRKKNFGMYMNARNSLEFSEEIDSNAELQRVSWLDAESLKQSSFLDELVFWTIKFEFPQKLICLLLNMMPDLTYKEAFTKIFVRHYGLISKMLSKSKDSDTLSNRVVHVSVQLFSNEDLAYKMTKHFNLLQTMVNSLNQMMLSISHKSVLQCQSKNEHLVVDCGNHIMKEHCYWPLVSDLNNVLTHAQVAYEFLSDRSLLEQWFRFLSLFQGMNVNQRELNAHVEFESNTYYAAFSAELEASASPMWALISHLRSPDYLDKTNTVMSICLSVLQEWFHRIGFDNVDEINPYQVSFHLPLHRCFASFLGQAVRQQGAPLQSLVPREDILQLMMMHPLQAQVAFHEILCNMWVRSGLQIKGQAMTYIQCHFCNSIVDADLFLLQICAMELDPDWFLKTVMQRFHVWEWFTLNSNQTNSFLEADKVMPMLEGALSFLATLLSTHLNIGMSEEQVTRQEMISLLCMSDRTHSQLMDLLPDKCGETSQNKNFETILNQVADYKAPNFEATGAMMQGTYVPKPEIWEQEYDPLHVLLRSVHRREYQASLDRFTQYLKQSNKISGTKLPWPPFRIPPRVFEQFKDPRRILHCKTMHGIILTILSTAVNEPDLPEQILSFCIYLLDMAVRFPNPNAPPHAPYFGPDQPRDVDDMKYEDWFDSSDTLTNIAKRIGRVKIVEKVGMSMRMVEEMEVDEEIEEEIVDLTGEGDYMVYDAPSPIIEEEIQDISNQHPSLPPTSAPLALTSAGASFTAPAGSATSTNIVQLFPGVTMLTTYPTPVSTLPQASGQLALPSSSGSSSASSSYNMAVVPTSEGLTTIRPKCMKLKQVPGRHSLMLTDKGLPLAIGSSDSDGSHSAEQRLNYYNHKKTVNVGESILSLLIQLHSKLSERPDSYRHVSLEESESRIGEGALCVERLLDRIALSGEDKMDAIRETRQRLWPKTADVHDSPSSENIDREERRRKAKERQKKLMAEFASKQKAFMQKTMETDAKEGTSEEEEPSAEIKKEYECVICSQMSASEEDRPVGMVVLLQATSVAGHYHDNSARHLPCEESDSAVLKKGESMAGFVKSKIDLLLRFFDHRFWPMALNIGWEGGVYVQTCGHYLHIDCHKAYIASLKNQNQLSSRLQNLAVESGEYFCPLCRQLANSVIPLTPGVRGPSPLVQFLGRNMKGLASEISELLGEPLSERDSNLLKTYMAGIMEDITNATYPQYRSLCSPSHSTLFLFVCSIARTNLEIELVQRGPLCEPLKKKSCFVPLMNVLHLHSNLLSQTIEKNQPMDYAMKVWSRLSGQICVDHYSLTLFATEVPLLLRDPIALLLQIILSLPISLDKGYFRCVVQVIYNFLYIQSLVQLSCKLSCSQRVELSMNARRSIKAAEDCVDDETFIQGLDRKMRSLEVLLGYVIGHLEQSMMYSDDDEIKMDGEEFECTENSLQKYVQHYCLHFLKISSLLQNHLFEEDIQLEEGENEYGYFCRYLGLTQSMVSVEKPASFLEWSTVDPRTLIKTWCDDYIVFVNKSPEHARNLLQGHRQWNSPTLLKLPHNYDDIFKYYHKRACTVCHNEPKDPSLCLVCGFMVCLRENCCRQQAHYEAVLHSISCGAGTAIYLAVNSSTIIVIRGKRACLWGSVYLDSYGEEDRDLKRGKPLYLSTDRYSLLQQQWINHSFDHTNKRWVWHKDNL